MLNPLFTIKLSKENFKFSGSHFTIFGEYSAERLHGHNYYVAVELEVEKLNSKLGMAFDFNELKPIIKSICDELDERFLIPLQSPYLEIIKTSSQVDVNFGQKKYSLPLEDVMLLEVPNITSEELSRHIALQIIARWKPPVGAKGLSIDVQETRGQSVTFSVRF